MGAIDTHSIRLGNSPEDKELKKRIEGVSEQDIERTSTNAGGDGSQYDGGMGDFEFGDKTRKSEQFQKLMEKSNPLDTYLELEHFNPNNDELSEETQEKARKVWLNVYNFGKLFSRRDEKEKVVKTKDFDLPYEGVMILYPVSKDEFEDTETISNWKVSRYVMQPNEKVKLVYHNDKRNDSEATLKAMCKV